MEDKTLGLKKCAVLCVIKNNNQVLLLKRNREPHKGEYIPIGGKLEPNESPIEAVRREVFEETGLTLQNVKYAGVLVETSPTKFNWVNFVYISEVDYFVPNKCDEGEHKWVDVTDIKNIPTPTTDLFVFEYIKDKRNFMFNAIYNNDIELIELSEEIEGRILYTIQ